MNKTIDHLCEELRAKMQIEGVDDCDDPFTSFDDMWRWINTYFKLKDE